MHHFAVKALPHTLLFRTWEEGLELWHRLVRAAPGAIAICVMPDHIHVLHARDVTASLRAAMSAYARWRNARRGESGPVWQALPPPTTPTGKLKRWRDEKYVHKNPCRAALVRSPLAWPLSTYRDALGLSLLPVRRRAPRPHDYHQQTCRDDHVDDPGLPVGDGDRWGRAGPLQVIDAVSAPPLLRACSATPASRRSAPAT